MENNQLAPLNTEILSQVVLNGDLSKLSPVQKVQYYQAFCERVGLDGATQPFKLLKLNGKEILYCDRSGTQQLSKKHSVSHTIKSREVINDCYVVTAQASTPDNRHTESIGAVSIMSLKGDALCNAMMKAETKAKRRATLDLLGLGMLDESEIETIPNAQVQAIIEPHKETSPLPPSQRESDPVIVAKAEALNASIKEKAEILLLSNSEVISPEEKQKIIAGINKLDSTKAQALIEKLKTTIAQRRNDGEMEVLA